jgi:hypothetical protein
MRYYHEDLELLVMIKQDFLSLSPSITVFQRYIILRIVGKELIILVK